MMTWPASLTCQVPYQVNTTLTAASSYKTFLYSGNTSVTTKKTLCPPLVCRSLSRHNSPGAMPRDHLFFDVTMAKILLPTA